MAPDLELVHTASRFLPSTYEGADTRRIDPPSELKIQFTGPQADLLLQAGPAEGKAWDVTVRVFVREHDA
jgi:hypothetical protein